MIMGRLKKEGKKATGIQAKKGYLYIIITSNRIKDGKKVNQKKWISTGLTDNSTNLLKAMEMRERILHGRGLTQLSRNITMEEFVDYYLEEKNRNFANTTKSSYFYRGKIIKKYLGTLKVRDIAKKDITNFLDALFIYENYSTTYAKDIRSQLLSIMEVAVDEGIIFYNPVQKISLDKTMSNQHMSDKKDEDMFLDFEQLQFFLNSVRDSEWYEYFYVTSFFGLRREEALGLRWENINLKDGYLWIKVTVTKGVIVDRNGKPKSKESKRQFPLTEEQIQMFIEMKRREAYYRELFGEGYKDEEENGFIFKNADGSLYYPDTPGKAFKRAIKKCPELPQDITLHGLRRSCISILVRKGYDIKQVQNWAGHSEPETTLRIYTKLKDQESKRIIAENLIQDFPPILRKLV